MNDDLYYYSLFESFTDMVSDPDTFSRDAFVELLGRLAEYFNVTKGVTEYYMSAQDEKTGNGEILIDYDTGEGDKLVIRRRIARLPDCLASCVFRLEFFCCLASTELGCSAKRRPWAPRYSRSSSS